MCLVVEIRLPLRPRPDDIRQDASCIHPESRTSRFRFPRPEEDLGLSNEASAGSLEDGQKTKSRVLGAPKVFGERINSQTTEKEYLGLLVLDLGRG